MAERIESDETGPAPVVLPADPLSLLAARQADPQAGRPRRWAIAVALLAHALVIAALLTRWPGSAPPPDAPKPIPVTLVVEKPPPAAPSPAPSAPAIKPPSPPPPPQELRSGPDEKTTAPPVAAPETAPEAEAPAPQPKPQPSVASGEAKPKPHNVAPPRAPPLPRRKLAALPRAPEALKHGSIDRAAPGDKEQSGDPYLNRLWSLVEQHRSYPANAVGQFGLKLEGTAVYRVLLNTDGTVRGIELLHSSGAPVLDQAARRMIAEAGTEFPPLPSYFPRTGLAIVITIHLFPGAG